MLIARYGIEEIAAPTGVFAARPKPGSANCDLHLPEEKAVSLRLKLDKRRPIDWVEQATARSQGAEHAA